MISSMWNLLFKVIFTGFRVTKNTMIGQCDRAIIERGNWRQEVISLNVSFYSPMAWNPLLSTKSYPKSGQLEPIQIYTTWLQIIHYNCTCSSHLISLVNNKRYLQAVFGVQNFPVSPQARHWHIYLCTGFQISVLFLLTIGESNTTFIADIPFVCQGKKPCQIASLCVLSKTDNMSTFM